MGVRMSRKDCFALYLIYSTFARRDVTSAIEDCIKVGNIEDSILANAVGPARDTTTLTYGAFLNYKRFPSRLVEPFGSGILNLKTGNSTLL